MADGNAEEDPAPHTLDAREESLSEQWAPHQYLKIANVMSQHPDYSAFRRFGYLNMLTLLGLQAELIDLENQLQDQLSESEILRNGKPSNPSFYALRNKPGSLDNLNANLLREIRTKLTLYHEALVTTAGIEGLQKPRADDLQLLNQLANSKPALTWPEHKIWQFDKGEYVTIAAKPRERSSFSEWLSPTFIDIYHKVRRGGPACKLRETPSEITKFGDFDLNNGVISYRRDLLVRSAHILIRSFAIVVASLMPIFAILALYNVKSTLTRIGISIVFTALFGFILVGFTSASVKEVFGAAAAFAAVEVVFIGSVN